MLLRTCESFYIQRLMITDNVAMLAGIAPQAANDRPAFRDGEPI